MQYKNGKYVDVPWPVVDPKNILDLTPGKMVEVKKSYWWFLELLICKVAANALIIGLFSWLRLAVPHDDLCQTQSQPQLVCSSHKQKTL